MKLEEIVGYLPHKLKIQTYMYPFIGLQKEPTEYTVASIRLCNLYNDLVFKVKERIHAEMYQKLHNFKPIFHPLSDLTKPITVDEYNNGDEFVPIERLLDIESGHNWSYSDYLNTDFGVGEWWVSIKDTKSSVFGYNQINGFYVLDKNGNHAQVRKQVELFQLLYKFHFDIHGLIERGEAIDINTLEEK